MYINVIGNRIKLIDCTETCILNGYFSFICRKKKKKKKIKWNKIRADETASNVPGLRAGKDVVCHYVSPLYHRQEWSYVSDRIELKRSKIEDRPPSVYHTFSFLFVYLHPGDTVKSRGPGIELFSSEEIYHQASRVSSFGKRRYCRGCLWKRNIPLTNNILNRGCRDLAIKSRNYS